MKLKLIETYLPLEALARAAANETRAGVGAPSSLHLWWGNRQVAIAKGLVFARLATGVERSELNEFDLRKAVNWTQTRLAKCLAWWDIVDSCEQGTLTLDNLQRTSLALPPQGMGSIMLDLSSAKGCCCRALTIR